MKPDAAPQEWQRYHELLLENISDIVITTDQQFQILSWNRIAEEVYALSAAEAIGKKMTDLVHFVYTNTTHREAIADFLANKIWTGEVSFTNRRGETFYFLQTVKLVVDNDKNEIGILALGRNITERKKAEEQLFKSEQFYRTLIADSLDATLLLNFKGEITFSTPSIKKLLGYELDEILNTNAFNYVHPEDMAWAFQSFEREVEENPDIKFIVVRLKKKDGEWVWCMIRGHNLLHVPYINSIAIYLHDDTPRKKASLALKESEERFRSLIRDLQIGVLLQNADGKIEMTNNAMCKLFSMSEEDILGGKIWEIFTDVIHEDGSLFLQTERPSYKAIQSRRLVKDVVMGVWHKGRKERVWIMISCDPILDENRNLRNIVCSFIDITERKKEEKKSLAEKMANQRQVVQATIDGQEKERREIGKELHDNIGQQLTTVKLFLDLAKTTATDENGEMISMALKGVSDLINEVRHLSRSLVPPSLKDIGFIESVIDLAESLRSTQAIAIEFDYLEFDEEGLAENKKLALFRIIQEQINNVIKHAAATEVIIQLRSTPEEGIMLNITDNGKGFDWATIRKGAGLKNIANRAELFGGNAKIISAPGHGCQVKICLPHSFSPAFLEQ